MHHLSFIWIVFQTVFLGVWTLDCDQNNPGGGVTRIWPELPTTRNLLLNREAELMAMESTGSLLPNRNLVNNIKVDLQAIRSSFPIVGNTTHRRKWAPGRLRFQFLSPDDILSINASEFGPVKVRHLNPRYRAVESVLNITYINFPAPYNPIVLSARLYDEVGIRGDPVQSIFTDGDDVIYNGPQSYTFVRGSGKCFISCEHKHFWHFIVQCNKNRSVTLVKEYSVTYNRVPSLLDTIETLASMR